MVNLTKRSIAAGMLIGCGGFVYSMVADIFYYGVDWLVADGSAVGYIVPWLAAVGGNLVGCNIPRLLTIKEEAV